VAIRAVVAGAGAVGAAVQANSPVDVADDRLLN